MSPQLSPWMRCPNCQKIHLRSYIGLLTVCECGQKLYRIAYELDGPVRELTPEQEFGHW